MTLIRLATAGAPLQMTSSGTWRIPRSDVTTIAAISRTIAADFTGALNRTSKPPGTASLSAVRQVMKSG
jgi:hypothetical protein